MKIRCLTYQLTITVSALPIPLSTYITKMTSQIMPLPNPCTMLPEVSKSIGDSLSLIIIVSDTRLPGLSVQSHIHDIVPGTACLNSLPLFFVGLTVASKNNTTISNGECQQSKHVVLKEKKIWQIYSHIVCGVSSLFELVRLSSHRLSYIWCLMMNLCAPPSSKVTPWLVLDPWNLPPARMML